MPRTIIHIALASMDEVKSGQTREWTEPGVAVAVVCSDGTAWLRTPGDYRFTKLPEIETEQEIGERLTRQKREQEEAHADPSKLPLDDCYCAKCMAAVEATPS